MTQPSALAGFDQGTSDGLMAGLARLHCRECLGTSEAKLLKERIVAFGIVLVLVLVAVLGVLTFVGMEFITNAVR
jgi:hypothetical protein